MQKTHVKNWTLFFDDQAHADKFVMNKADKLKYFGIDID